MASDTEHSQKSIVMVNWVTPANLPIVRVVESEVLPRLPWVNYLMHAGPEEMLQQGISGLQKDYRLT